MQQPSKVGKVENKAEKMQFILHHHHCTSGLPLCVSGITHRQAVPLEIADHDRRRDAIRRQRSQARERFVGNRDMGRRSRRSLVEIIRDDLKETDVDDLDCSYAGCTAKAA